jgi:hypothetical protein
MSVENIVTPRTTFSSHRVDRVGTKLSLQSSELGPSPSHAGECGSRGKHTRLRERGGGVPILKRGQTLWYSRYMCDFPAQNLFVLVHQHNCKKKENSSTNVILRYCQKVFFVLRWHLTISKHM